MAEPGVVPAAAPVPIASLRDKIGPEYSRQSFAVSVHTVPVVSAPSPGCGFTLPLYV